MRPVAAIVTRILRMKAWCKAAAVACAMLLPVAAQAQADDVDVAQVQAQLETMRAALVQVDDLVALLDARLIQLLDRMDATEDAAERASMRQSADAMTQRLDRTEALKSELLERIGDLDATLATVSHTQQDTSGGDAKQ